MAKSSEFTAVGKDYIIIKRLGNAEHIISDETKKAVAAALHEAPIRQGYAHKHNGAAARSVAE